MLLDIDLFDTYPFLGHELNFESSKHMAVNIET